MYILYGGRFTRTIGVQMVLEPKEALFEACPAVARCYGLVAARPKIAALLACHESVATEYRAAMDSAADNP